MEKIEKRQLQSPAGTGVAVGTVAPDFQLTDPMTGKEVTEASFAGQDVLLVFLRGTWCPFCREQMRLLAENHDRLCRANITVLSVVCQSEVTVRRYLEEHPLPFPLLPDTTRRVAKAYGVHYWLSAEGINLARPALFVLNRESVVTFRYIGKNMSDLPVGAILDKFLTFLG